MKITLATEDLQKVLPTLNHVVSSKSQLSILLNFYLEAKGNLLTLRATDLEVGIEVTIPVSIEEEGAITIPARTFTELIASLSDKEITLSTNEQIVEVKSQRTSSIFQTTPASEYPKLYEEKGESIAVIPMKDLRHDFGSVVFSASHDTARPALSGVLVKREESGFLLVATDGYRLSLKHHQHDGESVRVTIGEQMIVPSRVFREVLSAKEAGEKVALFVSREKNQVIFSFDRMLIIGRLIEGEYPNYERIIPSDFSAKTVFDREELLKAVKICSIFARDAANIVRLSFKKDSIAVSSDTPSVGRNTVDIEARLTGEENEIAFNARYLLDVLSNIEEDTLVFEMTGPLNPGVFKIKDDESFLHLIMPIRVQG